MPIEGIPPLTPEEPTAPKKIPHVHKPAHVDGVSGIPVESGVKKIKDVATPLADSHIALYYLASTPYEDWVQPFCEMLATHSPEEIKRTWAFLGSFGFDAKDATTLQSLADKKEYSELIKALPA